MVLTYYALNHGSYSLIDRQQIAVFVWVAIGVAAICGVLPAVKPPRVLLIPLLAMLGMAAWTLLSLTWTESAERTFAEFARIIGYLGVMVLIWIGVGRTTWRLVAAGLLTAGVLVCFLTLMSRLWPSMFPSDTVAINLKTTRINYPFGYWNAVGCWSAMTVTLCLAYAGHARSGVVRGLSLAVVPMCAAGLYLAVSRAGFGGALFGICVVIALAQNRWLTFVQAVLAVLGSGVVMVAINSEPSIMSGYDSSGAGTVALTTVACFAALFAVGYFGLRWELGKRMRMPRHIGRPLGAIAVFLLLLLGGLGVAAYGGDAYDQFADRKVVVVAKGSDDRLTQLSGNRFYVWKSAWNAFRAHPVVGIGPGTFEYWWSRDGLNAEFLRDAHNLYLEALAETGVVGLSLLLAALGGLLIGAGAAYRSLYSTGDESAGIVAGLIGVGAVFVVQSSVDWMWESTAVAVFALASLGVAGSAMSRPRESRTSASKSIALLVASACCVIVLLPGLSNWRQIEKSQREFRSGNFAASVVSANRAIEAASWGATAEGQKALALEAAGEFDEALEAIRRARSKEPTNWRWPLVELQIQLQRGNPRGATEAFKSTKRLRRFLEVFGEKGPQIRG